MCLFPQNIPDINMCERESGVVLIDEASVLIKDILSHMKAFVKEQAMVPQEDVDRLVREAVEKERASLKRKIQEHSKFTAI